MGASAGTLRDRQLVEGRALVENKAIRALGPKDEAQLVNYLTATGLIPACC